jgi:hypothetical protein
MRAAVQPEEEPAKSARAATMRAAVQPEEEPANQPDDGLIGTDVMVWSIRSESC